MDEKPRREQVRITQPPWRRLPPKVRFIRLARYKLVPSPDDVLDVLIDEIESEFSVSERRKLSELPRDQDPIWQLLVKHGVDTDVSLRDVGRLWGMSRERVRQIQERMLRRLRGDMRDAVDPSEYRERVAHSTHAIVTDTVRRRIVRMAAEGCERWEISAAFGLTQSETHTILKNEAEKRHRRERQ